MAKFPKEISGAGFHAARGGFSQTLRRQIMQRQSQDHEQDAERPNQNQIIDHVQRSLRNKRRVRHGNRFERGDHLSLFVRRSRLYNRWSRNKRELNACASRERQQDAQPGETPEPGFGRGRDAREQSANREHSDERNAAL